MKLKFQQQLERANCRIRRVYFIEAGLASVIATGAGEQRQAEICIVGREGMIGVAVVLGMERSANDTFMQVEGAGQCMSADALRLALAKSSSLAALLLRYVHASMVQMGQTALANARGKTEERLARWLLMAHDRLGTDDLHVTQEFLSIVLGVWRTGVSGAVGELEKRGLISTARRCIKICDRRGLKDAAAGLYGVPEAEFSRAFGVNVAGRE
jgi:CRP-like cAMP-binding protein